MSSSSFVDDMTEFLQLVEEQCSEKEYTHFTQAVDLYKTKKVTIGQLRDRGMVVFHGRYELLKRFNDLLPEGCRIMDEVINSSSITESGIGSGSKRKRPDEDEEYKDEEEQEAVMAQRWRKISSTAATRARGKKSEEKKECCAVGCTTFIPKGKGTACDIHQCNVGGCAYKAQRQGGTCHSHGGKRLHKLCKIDGCTNQSKNGGVCTKHGAKRDCCCFEGCTNIIIENGVCTKHGAKRQVCKHEGCTNHAKKGGVCIKHGAKTECKHEGCTNHAIKGGVCWRHGAKRKRHGAK